ncbi:MAG: Protein fmp52, mitochondrial [Alectoria fallacina]|uniref:Protein fmp52, mitochondrial n=1 Tax=Alectoria fallacina TaxID=1903189 RepID=A0A8H3I8W4_9LECA|nr:MAG: Protein fmp52, mitochondrial [Alectoria fallacina]
MAERISSAALVGCTGLVGSNILATLTSLSSHPTVHAIARRDLPTSSANLRPIIDSDSSKWPSRLQSLSPTPSIFLSGLGTTRLQAGSFEAQRKIDYDLNLSLAKAAKESGVRVYILISSAGVSSKSLFPYSKMKAELDEAVQELGFPHTILVKPGLLLGTRMDSRPPEAFFRAIAKGLGAISKAWLTDWWAQDADVIGRAAVAAGMQCVEGKRKEGVWVVSQSDILRLGRTEWKGEK